MKKFYAFLAAALLCAPSLRSQNPTETVYTYADPDAETRALGWGRKVDHDVAIFLQNPSYEGWQIVGVSVDIPAMEGCAVDPVAKAWLTSQLSLDPETFTNIPDIGNPEGTQGEIINVGTDENPQYRLDITFPEPYILPAEGVYVGYSLSVTALQNSTQKYPVAIASSSHPEGGLYMHAGYSSILAPAKYKTWTDMATIQQAVSTMRVILRGNKISTGGVILPQKNLYAATRGVDYPQRRALQLRILPYLFSRVFRSYLLSGSR